MKRSHWGRLAIAIAIFARIFFMENTLVLFILLGVAFIVAEGFKCPCCGRTLHFYKYKQPKNCPHCSREIDY